MKKKFIFTVCLIVSLSLCCSTTEAKKKSKKSTPSSSSKPHGVFASLPNAEHIFGPEITQEDLKGKVVFLEYWGVNCPPCRASYPHLVELQKKYEKTGKFTVLASHVQEFSKKVTEFLSTEKVTFPVYQQFREPAAPCGDGIPHAALIDHTGKVVAEGYPTNLYKQVADLVKNTPPPMIGDTKVVYCKAQVKVLDSGKNIANTVKSLERMAKIEGAKGEEAKAIVDSVNSYLDAKKTRLLEKASSQPSVALEELTIFSKQINGLEQNKDVNTKISKLKKDTSLKKLLKFKNDIEKINEKLAKRESASTRKLLDKIKASLQKFIENESTTPAVAKEAKTLL